MKHTIIIAEAGVNHNGDPEIARRMIACAAEAGADYVKFQTFRSDRLVAQSAPMAQYQKDNTGTDTSQLEMLRKLELTADDFRALKQECERCGVGFMSSPFDIESVALLSEIGQDYWKIPSGEITNLPYLRAIGRLGAKVIMSTGMSNINEINEAIAVLNSAGTPSENITLLHCNTQYPTPMADVNLLAMDTLRALGCGAVGFSDHTVGIEVPIAAVARHAAVIEKHFTLDRTMDGPDHKASLEPDELKAMVSAIRNIEVALGSGVKFVSASESPNVAVARKSIVAAKHIAKGDIIKESDLDVKRPGTGLSPMMWDSVIGTKAIRDFDRDDLIEIIL